MKRSWRDFAGNTHQLVIFEREHFDDAVKNEDQPTPQARPLPLRILAWIAIFAVGVPLVRMWLLKDGPMGYLWLFIHMLILILGVEWIVQGKFSRWWPIKFGVTPARTKIAIMLGLTMTASGLVAVIVYSGIP